MRSLFVGCLIAATAFLFSADHLLADHLSIKTVRYPTKERVGTIIVDTRKRYLYLVAGKNAALRYSVGVGREGFLWSGTSYISRKAKWPSWRPPAEMLKRQPGLPRFMPGGLNNPLGARALYIGSSLYRIHGTSSQWSIGRGVSSGCIRLLNEQVTDLYDRVSIGSRVIVY